jgi:hypothetical protein
VYVSGARNSVVTDQSNEGSFLEGSASQTEGLSSSFYESTVSIVETIDYVGLILDQRLKLLSSRIQAVDECINLCKGLADAHIESEKLNLCEADLIERRTELKEKDLELDQVRTSLKESSLEEAKQVQKQIEEEKVNTARISEITNTA